MGRAGIILSLVWLVSAGPSWGQSGVDSVFYRGVDVSYLDQLEQKGAVFYDLGQPGDLLEMFARNGVNAVRLRLWHTPAGGVNGLARTLQMAQRIKAAGMDLMLDIHYSDSWADPGKQNKPAAWKTLDYTTLKDSVKTYTHSVIAALKAQGTLPAVVQIGNEITGGMLWPEGRVGGSYETATQWNQLAALLTAGIEGVHAALSEGDTVRTMIHIDKAGDSPQSKWFFDNLTARNVPFDLIGLSYYYWWGSNNQKYTLTQMSRNLNTVTERYGKDVIIAETAYPFTLLWDDNTNNLVGLAEHLHPGYPASRDGQKQFLQDLFAVVRNVNGGRGAGVFYWEPDWIAVNGLGSSWENLALFSFDGELLPAIEAFAPGTPDAVEPLPELPGTTAELVHYPEPAWDEVTFEFALPVTGAVRLEMYDLLGRVVAVPVNEIRPAGRYRVVLNTRSVSSGLYLCRFQTGKEVITRSLTISR